MTHGRQNISKLQFAGMSQANSARVVFACMWGPSLDMELLMTMDLDGECRHKVFWKSAAAAQVRVFSLLGRMQSCVVLLET